MDASSPSDIYLFCDFRLDRRGGGLFRCAETGGPVPVSIGSRALDVLGVLVERHGDLVAKDELMAAVWPNTVVEEANLTVQISTLRRVLDAGRPGASCIQTAPGRGYRFLAAVTKLDPGADADVSPTATVSDGPTLGAPMPNPGTANGAQPAAFVVPRVWHVTLRPTELALAGLVLLLLGIGAAWWLTGDRSRPVGQTPAAPAQSATAFPAAVGHAPAPRLSLVVLPFENLSGDPIDDYLADGITDDLTTDLSYIPEAFVIARESAYTYKGKATDVRQIGRELGVRYVLEGSVRRINSTLRVNAQLISAETGAHLWADRLDEEIGELAAGQERIVTRMKDGLRISMVEIENARSLRERPTNPDAFDLILRARSLQHQPSSPQRSEEALALYERALLLDPSSVPALSRVAYFLVETRPGDWGSFDNMQRAGRLLAQARSIAPESAEVLNNTVYWLRSVGRCAEVIEATEHAIRMDPNRMRMWTGVYNELAVCKTRTGHAEEEIALQARADQLNPRSPWKFIRYSHMGFASLMLGRDQDAITFLERALAMNPESGTNQWAHRVLTAAYARAGRMAEAKRSLAEADRLWPYDTVRSHFPDDPSSAVFARQIRDYQAGLRLAGERDHADEDADFGVPADDALETRVAGRTPTGVPGAQTIRTVELVRFLAEAHPVVIDTVSNSWGRSIPGAIGLQFSGLGGSLADTAQDNLRRKMHELTAGDLNHPVVAVGWNSERFDGRNLALRLVALGYAQVYWYRGGREAWETADLPETHGDAGLVTSAANPTDAASEMPPV
jgi:adenylate cyclase